MGSDNLIKNLLKGGISLLFLYWTNCFGNEENYVKTDVNYQSEFINGVNKMLIGENDEAINIFKKLYSQTKSSRVKLEWARAAFLAKEYELSIKLFDEILLENIPESVRFNIGLYQAELAKIAAINDYGFVLMRDTNPFLLSKPQTVYIYGLPFGYEPKIKKESLNGINFYFNRRFAINGSRNLHAIAGIDVTQYEGEDNNKYTLKYALDYRFNKLRSLSVRTGKEMTSQRNESLMEQTYVNFQHRMDYASGPINMWQVDFKITSSQYEKSQQANSVTKAFSIGVAKNLTVATQFGASFYTDINQANYDSLSFKTYSGSVFIKQHAESISSILQGNLINAHRIYHGVDELFVMNRSDVRSIASIVGSRNQKIFGLYPSLELGIEEFESNIPINSYRRNYLNIYLKKSFN